MVNNKGFEKEANIIFKLDGAKIKDLEKQERYLLRCIYGELEDEEKIRCETLDNMYKPDFYIIYKGVKKYVSFKTGNTATIHQEYLSTFIDFLKEEGISAETIEDFLFFFYRDGTIDGSGNRKMVIKEIVEKYPQRASRLNDELNYSKEFVKKCVMRMLLIGRDPNNPEVDYICYWRDYDKPVVVNKRQIMAHLDRKEWNFMENPHIGPIQFRPHVLYKKDDAYRDKYVNRMDCWWSNFLNDLDYIERYYMP